MKTVAIFLLTLICGTALAGLEQDIRNLDIPPRVKIELVNSSVCVTLSDIALSTAKYRDAGVSRDAALEKLEKLRTRSPDLVGLVALVTNYAYDTDGKPMDVYADVGLACKKVY